MKKIFLPLSIPPKCIAGNLRSADRKCANFLRENTSFAQSLFRPHSLVAPILKPRRPEDDRGLGRLAEVFTSRTRVTESTVETNLKCFRSCRKILYSKCLPRYYSCSRYDPLRMILSPSLYISTMVLRIGTVIFHTPNQSDVFSSARLHRVICGFATPFYFD